MRLQIGPSYALLGGGGVAEAGKARGLDELESEPPPPREKNWKSDEPRPEEGTSEPAKKVFHNNNKPQFPPSPPTHRLLP